RAAPPGPAVLARGGDPPEPPAVVPPPCGIRDCTTAGSSTTPAASALSPTSGRRTHHTVVQALTVLRDLDHRGAKGSDPDTGDGAGILTQMPDALFRASCPFELPAAGGYAAGLVFLPEDPAACAAAQAHVAR